MPLVAVLLVVGAAACHCAWNLILKSQARRAEVSLGAMVVGVLLCAPSLLVYSLRDITLEAWAIIVLSGAFETAYVLALTAAYGAGDLSLVYPIARGTPALFVAPLSILLLGEPLSAGGLVGIALVVIGIFATSELGGSGRPPSPPTFAAAPAKPGRRSTLNGRAVVLALLTGVAIACYSFLNKLGVARVPVPLYATLVFAADVVLLAIVLRARGSLPWPPLPDGSWKPALVIGVLMMAAYLGVLAALARAPLAYVVAAREFSIVLTMVAGIAWLGERASARRVFGAALIFAGLVAIALSR